MPSTKTLPHGAHPNYKIHTECKTFQHFNSFTTCIDMQHQPYLSSTGLTVGQLGAMLTHATNHPAHQMALHLYGRLMHVTIKIALQINVKSAAFVLALMGIAEEHQNLLAHHVMMVIIIMQPLANVTTRLYA